jgi:hypothetical protein
MDTVVVDLDKEDAEHCYYFTRTAGNIVQSKGKQFISLLQAFIALQYGIQSYYSKNREESILFISDLAEEMYRQALLLNI